MQNSPTPNSHDELREALRYTVDILDAVLPELKQSLKHGGSQSAYGIIKDAVKQGKDALNATHPAPVSAEGDIVTLAERIDSYSFSINDGIVGGFAKELSALAHRSLGDEKAENVRLRGLVRRYAITAWGLRGEQCELCGIRWIGEGEYHAVGCLAALQTSGANIPLAHSNK